MDDAIFNLGLAEDAGSAATAGVAAVQNCRCREVHLNRVRTEGTVQHIRELRPSDVLLGEHRISLTEKRRREQRVEVAFRQVRWAIVNGDTRKVGISFSESCSQIPLRTTWATRMALPDAPDRVLHDVVTDFALQFPRLPALLWSRTTTPHVRKVVLVDADFQHHHHSSTPTASRASYSVVFRPSRPEQNQLVGSKKDWLDATWSR